MNSGNWDAFVPFPFQAILIAGATGYLLTGILFLVVRTMPRTQPGAGWWALSSLAGGSGYLSLLAIAMNGNPVHGEAVYNLLFIGFAFGLYAGGRKFLGLNVPVLGLASFTAVTCAWLIYFDFIAPWFLPASIGIALYCGGLNIHLAWLWWKHASPLSGIDHVLIMLLAISGLHWLDYPVLRPVEWFAPIGFSLCAVTASLMNGILATVLLNQFRKRMERAEQDAMRQAHRDPLTDLSNRLALDVLFEQALAQANRHGQRLAMLFLDLDDFKPINDTLGHEAGDTVLKTVGTRLRAAFRESDIIARIGGDEFVIILVDVSPGEDGIKHVQLSAQKALDLIQEPIETEAGFCRIRASVGVSYTPDHGETLNHIMLASDKAMYDAKAQGKGLFIQAPF